MRASVTWLRELTGIDATPEEMATRLTALGLEVEGIERFGDLPSSIVVATVVSSRPHPKRPGQSLVVVDDGAGTHEVVCGAPNVPAPGGRVVFARLGTKMPNGLVIEPREIAGEKSHGMLASEAELGIGADSAGILVLAEGEALPDPDAALLLSLTPNRPDCLGHVGLARELCASFGKPFDPNRAFSVAVGVQEAAVQGVALQEPPAPGKTAPSVEIRDADRCGRYGASVVEGVRIGPSPLAVRFRLHVLGVRALSNVVDATNLALFGWGYPTHAFDLDRLAEHRIVVRLAKSGETMATLDGVERRLTDDDLLICDAEKPVAIAGVMGGATSEIHAGTTRVLLECAYFDPRSVRRTSRRVGLHTDASHRFERGVDAGAVPSVLADVSARIAATTAGAHVVGAVDVCPRPPRRARIELRAERATKLIGVLIEPHEATKHLTALGCEVSGVADQLTVDAPTWRPDLLRETDLIEELARLHGIERIPFTPPPVIPSAEGTSPEVRFVRELRETAASVGLNEAINYAFLSPKELADAKVPTDAVVLANPLSEERSVLRTSLLPGLLGDLGRAQRHGENEVALFEVANVFAPDPTSETGVRERRMLAVMIAGPRKSWDGPEREIDFWDGKGAIESIVSVLTREGELETKLHDTLPAFLHPRRAAALFVGGERVGELGQVHPDVREAFGIVGRPIYAQLDVATLFARTQKDGRRLLPQASSLPRFPAVTRDLAVIVREDVPARQVATWICGVSPLIDAKSVRVFDEYRGEPVPKAHRSLAFRIVYRDPEATLTDKVVDELHATVVKRVSEQLGAELRK